MNIKKQENRRSLSTKIMTAITIILMLVFLAIYPVLFQEGNPIPILKGIMILNIREDKIVEISEEPKIYIAKTEEGISPITELMEREGWKLDEQLGAGYIFLSDNNSKLIIESTQYTGKYTLWKVGYPLWKVGIED